MDDELNGRIDKLQRAIREALGSEVALLSTISEGMRLGLASRNWRYVEITRQTVEEAVVSLSAINREAS